MSRRNIPPHPHLSTRWEVVVGWDRPMATYFAQVHDLDSKSEEEGLVLWVGTQVGEIKTPEAFKELLKDYADISDPIMEALRFDRAQTLDIGNTKLQRDAMLSIRS